MKLKNKIMVQENEIKCGNWFQHNANWCYRSPAEIKPFTFQWDSGDWYAVGESTLSLEDIEPIPLSTSVLEKCGFKGLPHFNIGNNLSISLGRDRVLSVSCVGEPNEMVFLTEEAPPEVKNIIVARNFDYDSKTYLHQIQNLYHSLTGQEIQYNP